MPRGRSWKWHILVFVALPMWLAGAGWAQCTAGGSISQWQCWEQTITSSVDFYNAGAGNPYRDLILQVTFTNSAAGITFTQDAFWLGDTANPKNFKVRAALPEQRRRRLHEPAFLHGALDTVGLLPQ